jgi:hypothetical protein
VTPTRWLSVLCLACSALSSGCGYALAGHGAYLPSYIKTIGIPAFTNTTTVFNVETLLTEKVRREFIGRGKYTVLPQNTDVDALLTGTISSIALVPVSFAQTQLASRYTITLTASLQLRDTRGNALLWENQSLVFRQDYDAPSAASGTDITDPNAFFGQDLNALDRLGDEFARTVVSAILEAF